MSGNDSLFVHPLAGENGLPPAPVMVRAKQICGPILPIGISTWWKMVAEGRAPKGIKISSRITVWRRNDVLALIDRLSSPEAE